MSANTIPSPCPQCGYDPNHKAPRVEPAFGRIQALLSSNDVPDEVDKAVFQRNLTGGQSELQWLDKRIRSIRTLLEQLENNRGRIAEAIQSYPIVLHPMRRLPRDVLGEIFLQGVDEDFHDISSSRLRALSVSRPPWLYCRVSHRWNNIARSMPLLWSRVKIRIGFQNRVIINSRLADDYSWEPDCSYSVETRTRIPSALLGTQLQLSHDAPLSISLIGLGQDDNNLCLLLSHSMRWQSLSLEPNLIGSLLRGQYFLGNLRHLHLIYNRYSESVNDPTSILPWNQITSLQITNAGPAEILTVLRRTPGVKHFKAEGSAAFYYIGDDSVPPVVLRELKLLEISADPTSIGNTGYLFDNLRTAALESLRVSRDSLPDHALPDLLQRSKCHLRFLDVDATFDLTLAFPFMPTLENLTIRSVKHSCNSIFASLAVTTTSESIPSDLGDFDATLNMESTEGCKSTTSELCNLDASHLPEEIEPLTSEHPKEVEIMTPHPLTPKSDRIETLLPYLRNLDVHFHADYREDDFDTRLFLDMIESRWFIPLIPAESSSAHGASHCMQLGSISLQGLKSPPLYIMLQTDETLQLARSRGLRLVISEEMLDPLDPDDFYD